MTSIRSNSERAQLARPALLAEREHAVEAAIQAPAIKVANAGALPGERSSHHLGERPVDIDGGKIGHVGGGERGPGVASPVADRRPRQIVGILAFDEVGAEALERTADRPIAQEQPIIGAFRHVRRANGDGDRPPLLDDRIGGSGNDQQMAVPGTLEDVLALAEEISANAAALLGPALREVAEEQGRTPARCRFGLSDIFTAHRKGSEMDR